MGQAVAYCRVSTEEQTQNLSLASQRKICLEWCQRNDYEVAAVFVEEGESAKTADRTQLKELLKLCRERKDVEVVVVARLDRWARNSLDHANLRSVLGAIGVTLRSATEAIDDTYTGKFMETVLSAVAELDNSIRADRSIKGMKGRLEQGQWTFPPPIGYLAAIDGKGEKTIMPDPERAPLVEKAFGWFSAGIYTKEQVRRKLDQLGLKTKRGHKLSAQSFNALLRKPVYAGWIVVPKWDINVQGRFTSIVDRDTFDRVQALLQGRAPALSPRKRNHPDFPLRHFVRCGDCGKPMTASWSTSHTKRKYAFYRCQHRGCITPRRNVSKAEMESEFCEFLHLILPKPEHMRLFRAVFLDVCKGRQTDAATLQDAAEKKVLDLRERKRKLDEAFVYRHAIDERTYQEMKAALLEQLNLAEMEQRDARKEELDFEAILNFAEFVLRDAGNFWSHCSLEQKQRFQQVLFPAGVYFANGAYRTPI